MSLLDDNRPTNPAVHFMQIKSGAVSYYDKESGQDVKVATPLEFIVLDQLATVKGWSNEDESGYWSNEVRSVAVEILNVRTKNGLKASGLWKDIKGEIAPDGAKYNASIYIAVKGRTGLEIQNLALKGASLQSWIEFTKKNDVRKHKVVIESWKEEGKAVKYKVPVFATAEFEDGELEEAKKLALALREYHNEYFSVRADSEPQVAKKDVVVSPDDFDPEEPIDLSEIPF